MSRVMAVNWLRSTSIFVTGILVSGSVLAAPSSLTQKRFAPWELYLSRYRPHIGEYLRYDSEIIKRMNPFYNGKSFLINNYNQSAYRWSTNVLTTFDTSTIVTTNVNFFSNVSTTSQELFTTAFSSQILSADNWVNARANYLEATFGFSSADAITTAISERSICQSSGSSCSLEGFITDYQLVNFGPDTAVSTNSSVSSSNTTPTTTVATHTSGNTSVTVTTTSQTSVVTSTNSTKTTVTQGTQDIVTQASEASGGPTGTVTSSTTTDTRTFVDETTEVDGSTTTTTTSKKDTATSTTSVSRVKKDAHWKLSIAPLVFFDFQSDKKLVSLNSHYPSVSMTQLSENGDSLANINTVGLKSGNQLLTSGLNHETFAGLGSTPTLKVGPQPGGYRVIQRRSGLLGAGAAATLNLINGQGIMAGVAPFAGLVPMIGESVVTEQMAENESHAEKLPKLADPRNADNLRFWQNLDKMTFSSNGGVLFMGGLGFFGLNAGVSYIALGTWTTEVQKIDTQKVYVKLTKVNLESFGYIHRAAFVSVSKSTFNNVDDSFSYLFDLSDASAKAAYNDLMNGQLTSAQRLAANSVITSVIPVETTRSVTAGRMWSIGVGIPFISWSAGGGDLRTASTRQFHPDASRTEVDYGVYLSSSDWRFFSVNRNRTYGFYAASYKNTDRRGKSTDGVFAQVGYSYRKNASSDQYDLRMGIQQLVRRTGLKRELSVQVPDTADRLRHFDVEFLLTISQSASELLMNISQEDDSIFRTISEQFMRSYFTPEILARESDYNDVCADHAWDSKRCVDEMQRDTRAAIRDMQAALKAMKQTYQTDSKAFVDHYARFGKAMLTNQFTFQTVFNLLKGRGIWARYRITGTRIASYDLSFDWRPIAK